MNKLLELYNLPILNHEEIRNLNRPIMSKEIESVIKNLQTNKSPGLHDITGKFCQTFIEELMSVLLKLFQKFKGEGALLNSFLWGQHFPDTKARWGHYKKRKLQANNPDEYRCKNSSQNISKPNSTAH